MASTDHAKKGTFHGHHLPGQGHGHIPSAASGARSKEETNTCCSRMCYWCCGGVLCCCSCICHILKWSCTLTFVFAAGNLTSRAYRFYMPSLDFDVNQFFNVFAILFWVMLIVAYTFRARLGERRMVALCIPCIVYTTFAMAFYPYFMHVRHYAEEGLGGPEILPLIFGLMLFVASACHALAVRFMAKSPKSPKKSKVDVVDRFRSSVLKEAMLVGKPVAIGPVGGEVTVVEGAPRPGPEGQHVEGQPADVAGGAEVAAAPTPEIAGGPKFKAATSDRFRLRTKTNLDLEAGLGDGGRDAEQPRHGLERLRHAVHASCNTWEWVGLGILINYVFMTFLIHIWCLAFFKYNPLVLLSFATHVLPLTIMSGVFDRCLPKKQVTGELEEERGLMDLEPLDLEPAEEQHAGEPTTQVTPSKEKKSLRFVAEAVEKDERANQVKELQELRKEMLARKNRATKSPGDADNKVDNLEAPAEKQQSGLLGLQTSMPQAGGDSWTARAATLQAPQLHAFEPPMAAAATAPELSSPALTESPPLSARAPPSPRPPLSKAAAAKRVKGAVKVKAELDTIVKQREDSSEVSAASSTTTDATDATLHSSATTLTLSSSISAKAKGKVAPKRKMKPITKAGAPRPPLNDAPPSARPALGSSR